MGIETFNAKLRGAKNGKIEMPRKEFEEEHRRLPELLRSGTPSERASEAARQESEARRTALRGALRAAHRSAKG
jgi:hypothetical protein